MFRFSTGKILESLILIVTNVFGKSLYNLPSNRLWEGKREN